MGTGRFMGEFIAEIGAKAGWAILVAVVLWFVARRLTSIVRAPSDTAASPPDSVRPGWQRAVWLVGAGVLVWGLAVGIGWLIAGSLTPVNVLDVAIIQWFSEHRTAAATSVAGVADQVGDTPGIIAVLLIAAAVAHAVTRRWAPALVLLVATAGETTIFLAAQAVISRPRPDIEHLAVEPATSSFPSGHVAATLTTYGCIALLVLAWSRSPLRFIALAAAIVLPVAVAWARLYQGMHFPSDVLVSVIFAPLWLAACWWAFRPLPRDESVRFGRRPDLAPISAGADPVENEVPLVRRPIIGTSTPDTSRS